MEKLDIIYCRNCKYFTCKKIDQYSEVTGCNKDSYQFDPDKPELYCNKQCFKVKPIKKTTANSSSLNSRKKKATANSSRRIIKEK